jgi:hypothetical protein
MPYLQVFRGLESVGVSRYLPLHVGLAVVKIVVNHRRAINSLSPRTAFQHRQAKLRAAPPARGPSETLARLAAHLRHLSLSKGVHANLVPELLATTISQTMDTYSHVMPCMGDQTAAAMEEALS